MNTLLLVRHGESEWNRKGKIQGQANSPLTARGRAQAEAIGASLAVQMIDTSLVIYSSPLSRARETAALIAAAISRDTGDIIVDERLNDFNLGDITGYLGWDNVAKAFPDLARARLRDPHRFHPPNGESGADVDARLRSFLADLPQGAAALVVSHGVINKFIRSIRRNLSGANIIALDESQSTVYRLDGDSESTIEAAGLSGEER